MKQVVLTALRIIIPIGILGWLVWQLVSDDPQSLQHLLQAQKHWWALGLATLAYFVAVVLTFIRWFMLVRALDIPFRVRDAVRLGFVGYLFQFVSLGAVGGDLFKAVFLYREQESRKPEAIATILIDRVVGLLGLLVLASIAFFVFVDASSLEPFSSVGIIATCCATCGVFVFFGMLYTSWDLRWLMRRVPPKSKLRATLLRLQSSLDMYRRRRSVVLIAVGMSVLTHGLHAVTLYFTSRTLFDNGPTLTDQVVLWSIAGAIAALPVSPGGLGTFDLAYSLAYRSLAPGIALQNPGTLVAFLFRVICLAVAGVGILFYLTAGNRRATQESLPQEAVVV